MTDCFFAPCTEGCPINQNVPEYVALVGQGKYEQALRVIMDKNPLPFITGTICNHRCTTRCTRNGYEETVLIRGAKLVAAEQGVDNVVVGLKGSELKSSARVAIIGGGPAGMAAVYFLARHGVRAVIFEKGGQLGGVVRKIIPDFRIDGAAVDRDARIIEAIGVELVLNCEKKSVAELHKEGYKYFIFANGAWKHGELKLEKGRCLDVFDFLDSCKRAPEELSLGENVVVIGGGNTAMDAARAAKRAKGVKNVYIVYRRTKRYMPADLEELELALEEGVIFRELLSPVALDGGRLICAKMKLGERDSSGRRSPVPCGELAEVPADTVIAAVGESVETELFTMNGVELNNNRRAKTAGETCETNLPGVFVAGDARRGSATVVEAIADAAAIADSIAKAEGIGPASKIDVLAGAVERSSIKAKRERMALSECASREDERCLECQKICESCVEVCPNRANLSLATDCGRQIVHVDSMCNECGNCTAFCPWESAPYLDKFTMFADEAAFAGSKNEGFLPLDSDSCKVRLDGSEFVASLSGEEPRLPRALRATMCAFIEQIPICAR